MTRLEYARVWLHHNDGYAIPEFCQLYQDRFDSGIICDNRIKKGNDENQLVLELCNGNSFLVMMKIDHRYHSYIYSDAIEACIKYNELMSRCSKIWYSISKERFFMAIDVLPRRVYLDDIRHPQTEGFVVLRSYQEFVDYVLMFGCPSYISFDHDLGNNIPSGYDCLKWLIDHDLQSQGFIPGDFEINVHSANPVGKENIEKLWNSYKTFKTNL